MIIVFAMIVRLDHHGVTSFVRCLRLCPNMYLGLLNFLKAKSWKLSELMQQWQLFIISKVNPFMINGYLLLVLDGIKISKEGIKMPGNKVLHQSSDNSGKGSRIFGHHFGIIGILAGTLGGMFCIPIMAEVQEGVEDIHRFQGKKPPTVEGKEKTSIITLGLRQAQKAALNLKKASMLVLDAYYAAGITFIMARECCNENGERLLHVITRGKKSFVAYYDPLIPADEKSGSDVSLEYGEKVKIAKLFDLKKDEFKHVEIYLYGKKQNISYYCVDLIWKPAKEKIRFVLVNSKENNFFLMCSNLDWEPIDIIKAYSYRFKIEVSFKYLKNLLGAFKYHFWCMKMPKLSKKKNTSLSYIKDLELQKSIAEKMESIERFVNIGCIALGMLQILALNYSERIWKNYGGWLRTVRRDIPTEEVVLSVIRDEYYHDFADNFSHTAIYQIITEKRRSKKYLYDDEMDDDIMDEAV